MMENEMKNQSSGSALPPPPQLLTITPSGDIAVNWAVAENLAKCWDLGLRDHLLVMWAKVIVGLRSSMAEAANKMVAQAQFGTPRATEGGPVVLGDTFSWKPAAFAQLAGAMQEMKDDPAVVGMTLLLYRAGLDGLESKVMWSAAQGINAVHLHSSLALAAEDIRSGHNDDPVAGVGAVARLN
jgi:hypothetical protein